MPRVNFTVRRVRFLAISSVMPFLFLRRAGAVQAMLRGLFLLWKRFSHLLEKK